MHACLWHGDELVAEEEHTLAKVTLHFTRELVLELDAAGFSDVDVRGGYEDRALTADDDFVVFIARK